MKVMTKYLADCYPEGSKSFRGVVMGWFGKDRYLSVFNISDGTFIALQPHEIDTPIIIDLEASEL